MKRVGIITMYHQSENYGGILQAYALVKKINLLGANAKQIDFDTCGNRIFAQKNTLITSLKSSVAKCLKLLSCGNLKKSGIIKQFRESIAHTRTVNSRSVNKLVDEFDVFITGSDQVWNPSAMCNEYLLGFVPPEKTKLSYAASISRDKLTQAEQQVFSEHLSSFTDISVRESNDVALLTSCVDRKIEWVLDPVFLLDDKQWDAATGERLIPEKYVFCYFLNEKNKNPALIAEFAKAKNAVTVQIDGLGMSSGKITDKAVKNVGPEQFLSLIKHAEYILTDSFHAMSFSFIFRKNFMVFPRNKERGMESRITSFLTLIGRNDLFLDADSADVTTLTNLKEMDYSASYTELEELKTRSVTFLKKYL